MKTCGFPDRVLNVDWECIDAIRKRKRNLRRTRQFFELDVIQQLWFAKKGFYNSQEMKAFVDTFVKGNTEYI